MLDQETESNKPRESPLVSVVIPFRNRERFLEETVQSVLEQSYKNHEVLLVDDRSTDSSLGIANSLKEKAPDRVFVFEQDGGISKGASAARQIGLLKSKGTLVKFLDSDDVLFPSTLEREVAAFNVNPSAEAVCGLIECWYSWDESHSENDFIIPFEVEPDKVYRNPALLVHNLIAGGNKPGIGSVTVRRDFAVAEGLFEDEFDYVGEDQLFWAKLSLNGEIYVLADVLARYRQHSDSSCSVASESGDDIESLVRVIDWLEEYFEEQNVSEDVFSAFHSYKRRHLAERRLSRVKGVYRSMFSLETRYKLRNLWIKCAKLLRSSHR